MRSASANRARGSGWGWPRRRRSSRAPLAIAVMAIRTPPDRSSLTASAASALAFSSDSHRVSPDSSGGEGLGAQQRPQHVPFVVVAEVGEAWQVDGQVAGLAAEAGVAADDPQLGPVGEQDGGQGAVPGADLGLPLRAELPGPAAGG